MPEILSSSNERSSHHRQVLVWSAVATILCLPFSSALFLTITDGRSSDLVTVICLPVLMFYYQGFLTGLIIDVCLIGCTYFPIYFFVRRIVGPRGPDSANEEPNEHLVELRSPLSVRLLAIADSVLAVVIAISAIDRPLISLAVLILTSPVVFGIFNVKPWGWWAGIIFHGVIAIGIIVAWAVSMFFLVQDFGRPTTGHMELISPKAFSAILTILVVIVEIIAVVPLFVLTRKETRKHFLSCHPSSVLATTSEDR